MHEPDLEYVFIYTFTDTNKWKTVSSETCATVSCVLSMGLLLGMHYFDFL